MCPKTRRATANSRLPLLGTALLCALTTAAPPDRVRVRDHVRRELTAGPGYVQAEFVGQLGEGLADAFDRTRSEAMLTSLREQRLEADDVLRLLNGSASVKHVQKLFGSRKRELRQTRAVLDAVVDRKNRRLFFGVMALVMVREFDVDPSSTFFKQACSARDPLTEVQFKSLCAGSHRTRSRMQECFGFRDEDDQEFMLRVLERVRESLYMTHPMCESLGIARPSDYDARKFPELEKGMPGSEPEYAEGVAAGLRFDEQLRPLPYFGQRAEKLID